ncbi:MAG: hypothetical protein MUE73_21735, partial [Planctomycetes bacterium]|nr:hypothetical protein [Planctomycetota bacterium]
MVHRLVPVGLVLAAVAFALATPGETPLPGRSCGNPFSDLVAHHREDPATGGKWLEDDRGRRFPDVAAFYEAEARVLGEPWCRIDPDLREAILDPSRSGEEVHVSVLFGEQPLAAIAEGLAPALEHDLVRLRVAIDELSARWAATLPPEEELGALPLG